MKKGINLISKQKKYLRYEAFFRNIRRTLLIVSSIFLIFLVSVFFTLAVKNKELERVMQEKKRILDFLNTNKEVEAEFVYFRNKHQRLEAILSEDVNFLPYYNLITDSLKSASPEPILEKILITKDRAINFTLNFDNTDSIVLFLKFAESDPFLKNFSQLLISQFNLQSEKAGQNYQLNLVGQLIPINENKN